ncbi:lantibiotic dehydratase [Micromonospora sp. WMMA1923]|uniref:lantibiotic dehydratase n=1 Tax=Micromonospora sp. WMMA1923 TaxID=3404125 RepID=UPI003B95D481
MYQHLDAALLRAAVLPTDSICQWPDLDGGSPEQLCAWRFWLETVWTPQVAAAVHLASPVLAARITAFRDGAPTEVRQARGAMESLVRYLLRMTMRATPFGLFAGIAPVEVGGPAVKVCRHGRTEAVARPDAGWLAAVVAWLEDVPTVQDRLTVVTNNLCFVRGDRLVVPCQPHRDDAPAEVSVRHTSAVAATVQLAAQGCRFVDLLATLTVDRPDRATALRAMVVALLRRGVLTSDVRVPLTVADPLGHLLTLLRRLGAESIPEVTPVVGALRELHADLHRHRRAPDASSRSTVGQVAVTRMAALTDVDVARLAVDLRLDCSVTVPDMVTRRAEAAAGLLTRLDPMPLGEPAWRDFHGRFLERYGPGAVIAVRELVSDAGLGYPAGYRGTRYEPPPSTLTDRDHRLLAMAQTAAMTGDVEVILDETTVTGLEVSDPGAVRIAPHTELGFQVHARSRDAVDTGDFDLVVTAAFRAAGVTAGRFLHLLKPAERDRFVDALRGLPTLDDDGELVQLSCPPVLPRAQNLASAPAVLARQMALGEPPSPRPHDISVEDLAVTADTTRFQLLSRSTGRPVEVTVLNAVEFNNATHPLARLLCEISRSRAASCRPFSWGAAAKLPFVPRLRYGRIVLSLARWHLTPTDVPTRNIPWFRWDDTFAVWSRKVRLPAAVYVGGDDQRLHLDLSEPTHRRLLRAHLERHGHATLREAPDPAEAFGWLNGHAHEIIVPMASTTPPTPAVSRARTAQTQVVDRDHGELPGHATWLHAKLYGHPDRQPEILTRHLAPLLARWPVPPEWWYLRYRDPEPHLRLRIRLPHTDAYGTAAARVGRWATTLRHDGLISHLILDSYQPETGRYGSGPALAAAERTFAADSTAAVAELAAHRHVTIDALSAASLTDLAAGWTGSIDEGMRWLVDNVAVPSRVPLPRDTRRETVRLADPADDWAALRGAPAGPDIWHAWSTRRAALTAYRAHLSTSADVDPDQVLASLLHLHHIRVSGIDRDTEQTVHRLARAAALAWTARTRRTPR